MAVAAAEIRAFLICDVRGYTRYTVEHGDEAAARLAADFSELVQAAVGEFGGEVLELRGDEALVVFTSARQAVRAAVELQKRAVALPLGVGAGLDAGEAVPVLGGYRGQALNLAARLCSLAGPGEVLASDSLTHLAGRLDRIRFEPRGSVQLKGFAEPVDVVGIEHTSTDGKGAASEGAEAEEKIPIGAYLGSLPAGPLVGRSQEWERLRGVLDEVAAGSGRTVLVAGEPGAGKTRLVQEAMLTLRDRGFLIATGACLETRQTVPYFPFLDALPRLLAARRGAGRGLDAWPYLARLLAGGGGPDAEVAEEERVRRDVAGFVAELSRARPVAILLDDLHWADASTLELVHQLARQLRPERVLIAATYREAEVRHDHPLERVIRALRRDELATLISVRRLDAEGTAALVAACFGEESVTDEFAALIHGRTDGNPFFVQQVLRALVERGDVYREAGSWERRAVSEIEVPDSIRAAVGERVARLPEASREALSAAAILGQRFDFAELQQLSGLAERELEEALEGAVRSGLLRTETGDLYAFEHALAQQTLVQEMPSRRRRRLHGQAGEVIAPRAEVNHARAAEVAYHLLEADEPARAAGWSLIAARHAEQVVALTEAESHFRQAAELAEEAGDAALRVEGLEGLGRVTARLGRSQEAIAVLEKVLLAKSTAPPDEQASTAAELGKTLMTANRAREIQGLLQPYLELPGLSDRARAALLVVWARSAFSQGEFEPLREIATQAREAARRAGDAALEAEALGRLALAVGNLESEEQAAEIFAEALRVVPPECPLDVLAVLHNNYAWTLWTCGDFAGNVRHRTRAAELSERYASPGPLAFAMVMVGSAELGRGEMEEALRWINGSQRLLEGVEQGWHHGYVLGQEGAALQILGRLEEAEGKFRAALAAARARGDAQLATWMVGEIAVGLAETGRGEEAIALAEEELGRSSAYSFRMLHALAQGQLATGRPEAALESAVAAAEAARGHHNQPEMLEPMVTQGAALHRLGRNPEARAVLEEASEMAARMPYPAVLARAKLWLARIAAAEDRAEEEVALLGQLRELVERHQLGVLRGALEEAERHGA